ncbi:hypothetical protein GYMLUDRAFT_60609 [Collybiopsis luxurians FD-317 M1]|uniref:SCP domain-containing protein n=1 Tax=Collybiopsis luxurians FD-317 M1 TaxID=944289 RepID=A0A0D0B5F8_9AGAR|nr:hypothetical protein GYMLUDRAFT_60609 [Collybiopsis luxurians FD-317 M1]
MRSSTSILFGTAFVLAASYFPCTSAAAIGTVFRPRASPDDVNQYLSNHNSVRSQHGAKDLTWNATLAEYAQGVADKCKFAHSGGPYGVLLKERYSCYWYGKTENLAAGTGSYSIAQAIKSWADEAPKYNPNDPLSAGHFTQMVWKATTQLGCAEQDCDGIFDPSFGKAKFYVCEYAPPGNVVGEYPQNVQV